MFLTAGPIYIDAAGESVGTIKDEIWVGDNVVNEAHDDAEIAAEELFDLNSKSGERHAKGSSDEAEANLAVVAGEGKGRD